MVALLMVVISSIIAVGSLGKIVLYGIGRLDISLATVSGVSIVILAIILDRLSQSLDCDSSRRGHRLWYGSDPLKLITRPFRKQV